MSAPRRQADREVKNEPRSTPVSVGGALLILALLGGPCSAEIVCVQSEWPRAFKQSRIVALASVAAATREGWGATCSLSVIRNWKGHTRKLQAHTAGGEDGGWLRVGDYVLVHAGEAAFEFDSCNQPRPVYEKEVQVAISGLDRVRQYPPLSLSSAALKSPYGQ